MSLAQFLILAGISIVVTVPVVLLIPRARQSPVFDRVLWAATWLLSFLGASAAPNYINSDSVSGIVMAEVSLIPAGVGAAVGALSINVLLWLMDRLNPPVIEDEVDMPNKIGEENVDDQSTQRDEQ